MRMSDSHSTLMEQAGRVYSSHLPARQRAFTLVEMVTIILIIGILAVVAGPRIFNRSAFDSRGFHDQVISTLRYAQKIAIAQRTSACVTFNTSPSTVTISGVGPACATPLSPAVSVTNNNASFSGLPSAFSFNGLGSPNKSQVIGINSASSIIVEWETGYVH